MRRLAFALSLCTVGCINLALPETPPPPGPGTLSGTLTYALPGRPTLQVAKGARVHLLETSNEVRADDEGRFLLPGLTQPRGLIRITFDFDSDGLADRQRLFSLATLGAGPGRDVALGEVVLGRNARLTGRALRADFPPERFTSAPPSSSPAWSSRPSPPTSARGRSTVCLKARSRWRSFERTTNPTVAR